jgi:hypothetical protein
MEQVLVTWRDFPGRHIHSLWLLSPGTTDGWLEVADNYCLTVLEMGSPRWRPWAAVSQESRRQGSFLEVTGCARDPWVCGCITPSLPPWSCVLSLCLSSHSLFSCNHTGDLGLNSCSSVTSSSLSWWHCNDPPSKQGQILRLWRLGPLCHFWGSHNSTHDKMAESFPRVIACIYLIGHYTFSEHFSKTQKITSTHHASPITTSNNFEL